MQKKPLNAFGKWFYYTLSERRAAFYLCIIVIILSLTPFTYDQFLRPKPQFVIKEQLINQLEKASVPQQLSFKPRAITVGNKDINLASWYDLVKIGISKKTANAILNYRKALNGFQHKDQLGKVYGITSSDLKRISENFTLPVPVSSKRERVEHFKSNNNSIALPETAHPIVNINKADSIELLSLPGIGPYYVSKILRFRRALGGFHSKNQLKEMYGMPDSVLTPLLDFLFCQGDYNQINVNEADSYQLSKCLYISRKKAKLIITYRLQHGYFDELDQVQKSGLFSDEEMEKLSPYLTL